VGIAAFSCIDEQALLMQSGPYCTITILLVHAVIMGRNTHRGILIFTPASRKHDYK